MKSLKKYSTLLLLLAILTTSVPIFTPGTDVPSINTMEDDNDESVGLEDRIPTH